MRCNCESLACVAFHADIMCPNKTDTSSPTLPYLGKVCKECALRMTDNDPDFGRDFITWP